MRMRQSLIWVALLRDVAFRLQEAPAASPRQSPVPWPARWPRPAPVRDRAPGRPDCRASRGSKALSERVL